MKKYQYILLDLDGTIINPMVGITQSAAYALSHFNIEVKDLNELCPFIGPPLKDSFKEFYHLTDEQTEVAIQKYRERFSTKGVYENELYDGITDFLKDIHAKGYALMLATSKPTIFAKQILKYYNLIELFTFIGGAELDGSRNTKTDIIKHVLEETNISSKKDNIVMVGDRKHDIIGAKNTGIDSIGVLYGYGNLEELEKAKADYIVKDISGLSKLLLNPEVHQIN